MADTLTGMQGVVGANIHQNAPDMRIPLGVAAVLTLCCLQPEASAQATFYLRNHVSMEGLDAPVYDWSGALLAGPDWRAELYGGVDVDSLTPVWNAFQQRREIVPLTVPGYFLYNGDLAVLSVPRGGWAWLQLKVWDVGLGATYEEAMARGVGGFGQSAVFYARGGDPSVPTLPSPLIGSTSFSVSQVVPEPAIGWLLLAAGLPVLWWRGRKRR